MDYSKQISFGVDHHKLSTGIYLSKVDTIDNNAVYTFDLRIKKPYDKSTPDFHIEEIHAFEHSFAYCLRELYPDKAIYFGPGGCLTNFYLLLTNLSEAKDVLEIISAVCSAVDKLQKVPASTEKECGNCYILGNISDVYRINDILKDLVVKNNSFSYPI